MKFRPRPGYRLSSAAQDQSGVVSTYVSMGIIGILSLISISFAFLMQTEYIQARDRQFNTQARVAAETAINDARQLVYKAIGNRLNLSNYIALYDTCGPDTDGDGFGDPDGIVSGYDSTYGGSDGSICEFIAKYDNYDPLHNDGNVIESACISPTECVPNSGWATWQQHDHYAFSSGDPTNLSHQAGPTIDIRDIQAAGAILTNIPQLDFYDASGDKVVDVNDDILQRPYDTLLIEEWYDCGDTTVNQGGEFEGDLDDSGSNIEYTCVEVDGRPVKLVYDEINVNRSENVLVQTRSLSNLGAFEKSNVDTLTISWQDSDGPPLSFGHFQDKATHEQQLHPSLGWNQPAPMLRVQIIPLNIRDGWTRDDLAQSTRTYFLYPTKHNDGGTINSDAKISLYSASPTKNNSIVNADCDAGGGERACTVEISGFAGSVGSYAINNAHNDIGNRTEPSPADDEMVYIVLVRPIYMDADVAISAQNSNGDALRFVNQQINITATGRAGGLTYRIREVIPIRPKYNRPEYAIDSAEHICKVLIGEPNAGVSYDFGQILGSYDDPITASLQSPDDIGFCEDLHPGP